MPSPALPRPLLKSTSRQVIVISVLVLAIVTLPLVIPSLAGFRVNRGSQYAVQVPTEPPSASVDSPVSSGQGAQNLEGPKPPLQLKRDGKWRGDMSVRDEGITVVLLNFKRPEHLKKIVRAYLEMPEEFIRDVYVFNNDDIDFRDMFDPLQGGSSRVRVVDAHANLGIGNSRFFAGTLARTRAVLTQDDDLLLTRQGVERLYEHWKREPDRIHGAYSRGPTLNRKAGSSKRGASVLSTDDASPVEERMARKVRYEMYNHHLTEGQYRRQKQRVEQLHSQANGANSVWVSGSAWNAPSMPLRYDGMTEEEDLASACPILITRVVMFDRARAYQYFRWVLEMQDTVPQQKPFGHGEDLLLSLLSIRESGGKLNRAWRDVSSEISELPQMKVGVSTVNSDHLDFRTMFLQLACDRLDLPCWDWIMLDIPTARKKPKPTTQGQ